MDEAFNAPAPYQQYPPSLPHDIALCVDDEEVEQILVTHGITPQEYDYIQDLLVFKKEVSEWKQKMMTEGYSFKLKLRAISEGYIPELLSLLHNPTVAPSVKTDLFKYITKVSGLEPPPQPAASNSSAGQKSSTRLVVQWQDGTGTVAVETANE